MRDNAEQTLTTVLGKAMSCQGDAPTQKLFRIQTTFAAEASQLDTAQPSGLDHRRQLDGR
jgi:hypothetical protein